MKHYLLLLISVLFLNLGLSAQDFEIVGVESLPADMSARIEIKTDQNERQCALLRVATQNIAPDQREGFSFVPDLGSEVVERATRDGEIWLWVSPGLKHLRIKHGDYGQYELNLPDYNIRVESLHTYKIVIQGTAVQPDPVVTPVVTQYLTFQITPPNAMLEVDGEIWPVSWDGTARKKVNEGTYTYVVQAQHYESEEGTVTVADSAVIITVNLKAIEVPAPVSIEPTPTPTPTPTPIPSVKPIEKQVTFVTANLAYSVAPQWSLGFSVGQVKRFGWFVSAMTNGGFTGMGSIPEADASGFVEGGYLPMYNGETATDRLSIIAGGVMHVSGPLYVRAGLGYGMRNLCWQDTNGQWYKMKDNCVQGLDVSAGLQLHLSGFVVSAEAVTTNFQTLEAKLGLGYVF